MAAGKDVAVFVGADKGVAVLVAVGGNTVGVAVALEKAVGVAVVATVPGSSPQIKAPCR